MTQQISLEGLLAEGESQVVEFKKSLGQQRKALQALCAMVNSDFGTGTVVFGIGPDGSVCGIEPGNLDTAQRSLSQAIRDSFDPRLIPQIRLEKLRGKQVLLLSAKRPRSISYYEYDGKAWIREGTENRVLRLTEKEQLTKRRNRDSHLGPWRCDQCGSFVGQLFSYTLTIDGMKKTYHCHCGGEYWPAT